MKTLFAESITAESGRIVDYFQVTQVDRKAKKDGSPYLALTLGDRTGACSAKLWDVPEGFDARPGNFVKIEADASSYRDQLQLTVKRIRVVESSEISKGDYMPASKQDRDELLNTVETVLHSITDTHPGLRDAMRLVFGNLKSRLREVPAAQKLHQAYLGGLLEHTINLIHLGLGACLLYTDLDRDILLAGAFLHDIGKIEEYCYDTHIGYTRQGRLLGHILQGPLLIDEFLEPLDETTRDHLLHIIASHHGQKEWGAVQVPMTREAILFHQLDMIDAKMAIAADALAGPVDDQGFTPFVHALGTAVWNGK